MSSFLTGVLGEGPAATAAIYTPDLDHFRGSFGGKHVIPLWRNAAATEPNITAGLLPLPNEVYTERVTLEDIFAYVYAVLANPEYTENFSEELSEPGPQLPLTKDSALFRRATTMGKRLLWLHTYGERFIPEGMCAGQIPRGTARCIQGIPTSPEKYPEDFEYIEAERTLRVGEGKISPVSPEVWNFSVSGLQVVKSWLDYRKKDGAGRRSSPLDEIRPERWTTRMTQELLELIWVLEHTLAMYPELEDTLMAVVQSECFTENELPRPADVERLPPQAKMPLFPED